MQCREALRRCRHHAYGSVTYLALESNLVSFYFQGCNMQNKRKKDKYGLYMSFTLVVVGNVPDTFLGKICFNLNC